MNGARLLRALATLCLAASATAASADGHWPNGCNPETQFEDCGALASSYESGAFLPKVENRAQALRADLREHTFRRCIEGDSESCYPMKHYVEADKSLDDDARQDLMTRAFSMAEQRCLDGDADMCLVRLRLDDAYSVFAVRDRFPEKHEDFDQIEIWINTEADTRIAAFARASAACADGDSAACVEAAVLHARDPNTKAKDRDLTVTAPLLDACLADNEAHCDLLVSTFGKMQAEAPTYFAVAAQRLTKACLSGLFAPCTAASATSQLGADQPFFEAACTARHGVYCMLAGNDALLDWMETDKADAALFERAITFYTEGCNLGSAMACHILEHQTKL